MELPPDIPPEALPVLQQVGYMEPDRLHVGDTAPQITLALSEGGEITIGAPSAPLPTALIFGSYT